MMNRDTEVGSANHPPAGWWESYFDEDFYELYSPLLPEQESRGEAETVFELLDLGPGSRVLDLGCGWGRHSVELARLGCSVVGLDQSAVLLERARRLATERGVHVEWVRAEMGAITWEGEFDAVLSLFSSLGYSGRDDGDVKVLRAAARALRTGGSFLLDTMHRDQVARGYLESDWWQGADGRPVWVEREFDPVLGVSRETLRWLSNGRVREKYHEIRIRTATEWAALFSVAGLDPLSWYGGWDLSPFGLSSEQLLVVSAAE
ncbi:MAG: methyltransferase domain-containing protein [Gemmatimonadetes bacterium]|nr:methyltransferase domain-containing protein [Gemmatimonadota bacterium]